MYSTLFVLIAAVPAFAAQCSRSYTVKDGDYCDAISASQNTSTYQLAVLNSGSINSECSNLAVGQTLCLGDVASEDCKQTHVVQTGDICDTVMTTYGINATMLWTNNPIIDADCTNIYEGEVLCVSNQVQVPAAPASGIPAPSHTIVPASTSEAASPTVVNVAPTPTSTTSSDDGDDGDDEDLPFCDEM